MRLAGDTRACASAGVADGLDQLRPHPPLRPLKRVTLMYPAWES